MAHVGDDDEKVTEADERDLALLLAAIEADFSSEVVGWAMRELEAHGRLVSDTRQQLAALLSWHETRKLLA